MYSPPVVNWRTSIKIISLTDSLCVHTWQVLGTKTSPWSKRFVFYLEQQDSRADTTLDIGMPVPWQDSLLANDQWHRWILWVAEVLSCAGDRQELLKHSSWCLQLTDINNWLVHWHWQQAIAVLCLWTVQVNVKVSRNQQWSLHGRISKKALQHNTVSLSLYPTVRITTKCRHSFVCSNMPWPALWILHHCYN